LSWTNILVPLIGGEPDAEVLAAAVELAAPFNATVTGAYSSPTPTSLFAQAYDPGVGVTDLALAELQHNSAAGEARARERLSALDYPNKTFENVSADDWRGLRIASRLADLVLWPSAPSRGHGFFASAFQQIMMVERRPAMVTDRPVRVGGVAAVAWNGGREASNAARRAVPFLRKAEQVIVLTVPETMAPACDAGPLIRYFADQGVHALAMPLAPRCEAGPLLLDTARQLGAAVLVAGAFGHSRLQRFIFGGTTQTLLESTPPTALFLSH
jgi:hypothetical protein